MTIGITTFCLHAEYRYADCHVLFNVMLGVVMLIVMGIFFEVNFQTLFHSAKEDPNH